MTVSMILLAIAGFLIGVLLKLAKKRKEFKSKFKFKTWWKENDFQTLASVISIPVLLYFAPILGTMLVGTDIPKGEMYYDFYAFGIGWWNHSFLHDIMKAYSSQSSDE